MDYKNLFIIILVGFLVWFFVFHKKETPVVPAPETSAAVVATPAASAPETSVAATPVVETASPAASDSTSTFTPRPTRTPRPTPSSVVSLTRFISTNMEKIFEPMDEGKLNKNTVSDLKKVQETLRDREASIEYPTEKETRIFALAHTICKQLQNAINERDTHLARIEARKGTPSPLSSSTSRTTAVNEAQLKNDLEREKFFTDNIRKAWDAKAKQLKQEIEKNIDALRELERSK